VSREEAERLKAVCFYFTQDEIRVGAINPKDPEVQELLHQIKERNSADGMLYIISENSLKTVMKIYDRLPIIKPVTKDIYIKEEDMKNVQADVTDFKKLQELLTKTSTTDLVTFLLGAALKLGSSDLHIETEEAGIIIRVRLDGILHEAAKLDKSRFKKLLARIKLVSGLKINITDKPQDGRFSIKLTSGDVDVRVSTMPTVYGESIVMRLLPQKKEGITFDEIGLLGDANERLKKEIERPNGMIVTTGPTGSGKTTTLYSIMNLLNKPGVKIITLEDPVEYRMEGVNQSQVDASRDYTFSKGLRSILRQDPDIAMIGEIRDLETAEIATQAALTGHLILTTLHTNNAAAAIPRLLSMGVKPFLLAPSLNCIIGQRLVRRICLECKEEEKLSAERSGQLEKIIGLMTEDKQAELKSKKLVFYKSKGCDKCNKIGYKGRIGIYEVLTITETIEKVILAGKLSEYEIERTAVSEGMVTMVQDGILKALEGLTSIEEVFRVTE
jgi:type IV pilus assembly protein PilB